MHKPKITLFALLATLALTAITATTATTATAIPDMPELLQVKVGQTITTSSGVITITTLSGSKMKCTKSKGEGVITTRLEGTLNIDLEGCKEETLKTECLTKGDAKEVILEKLDWRLVYDTKPETGLNLGAGILFKVLEAHYECPKLAILVLLRGEFLGLLKPTNKLVKTLELVLQQNAGEPLEKTYWELVGGKEEEKTKETEPLESEQSSAKKFETEAAEIGSFTLTTANGEELLLDA